MKRLIAITLLSFGIIPLNLSLIPSSAMVHAEEPVKFICGQSFDAAIGKQMPTTFAWTSRGKIAIIRWETQYFPNYSPERRCKEVSPRFQEAYNNNTLNMLTNGRVNDQPVICSAKAYGEPCATMLITLRPGDDSSKILEHLTKILNGDKVGPVPHTGNQRFVRIDIEEFLRTAPVEK